MPNDSMDRAPLTLEALLGGREIARPDGSRYRVESEVGQGGMGVVLRVWDVQLERSIAMKIALGRLAVADPGSTPAVDERTLARFLDEARITAQLDHPGIVPVHELGVGRDGRLYFTMRLVRGEDLRVVYRWARTGQDGWTVTRVLGVLLKACEAVAYAHEKNVIHRDLKPANIMVGSFGEVVVMDWGLARVLDDASGGGPSTRLDPGAHIRARSPRQTRASSVIAHEEGPERAGEPTADARQDHEDALMTRASTIIGTPSYMPPEQALGRLAEMGPRADVYAVGAMLYELLSGAMPYAGTGATPTPGRVLLDLLAGPPQALLELAPRVEPELEAICSKAMAREPEQRYANMAALAEDLRAFLEGRVVRAHATGAWVEAKKWVRRNRALAAALLGGVLALTAGLVFALDQRARAVEGEADALANSSMAEARRIEAEGERKRAREAEEAMRTALTSARAKTYLANMRSAGSHFESGQLGAARERLAACPAELRGFEWAFVSARAEMAHHVEMLTPEPEELSSEVGITPDGELISLLAPGLTLAVYDARNATLLWRTPNQVVPEVVAVSPDSRRLLAGDREGNLTLWDSRTGQLQSSMKIVGAVRALDFAPEGDRAVVATAGEGDPLLVVELSARRITARLARPNGEVVDLGWIAGCGAIACCVQTIQSSAAETCVSGLVVPDENTVLAPFTSADGRAFDARVTCFAESPDGRGVVVGCRDGSIYRIDLVQGRAVPSATKFAQAIRALRPTLGGDHWLAIVEGERAPWLLDGGELAIADRLTGHEVRVIEARFDVGRGEWITLDAESFLRRFDLLARDALYVLPGRHLAEATPTPQVGWSNALEYARDLVAQGAWRWVPARGSWMRTDRALAPGSRPSVLRAEASPTVVAALDALVPSAGGASGVTRVGGEIVPFAIDAAGTWLAVANSTSGFDLVDLVRGARAASLQHGVGAITALAFDSSSRIVALAQGRQIVRLRDPTRGKLIAALETSGASISRLAFEREGRALAASSDRGEVFVWDLRTFELRARWRASGGGLTALDFGSMGTRLVTLDADGHLALWDALGGELLLESRSPERRYVSAAFVDDTSIACLEEASRRVWVMDAAPERGAQVARALQGRARAERRLAELLGDPETLLREATATTGEGPWLQGLVEERREIVARVWIDHARRLIESSESSVQSLERASRALDAAQRLALEAVHDAARELRAELEVARTRR